MTRLLEDIPTIRIGIIAHGDYCDSSVYTLKMHELTSNTEGLVEFVTKTPSTGGGDAPEVIILELLLWICIDYSGLFNAC